MDNNTIKYHTPVMLHPCMEGLALHADGVYVDLTFGGGGHSCEILKQIGAKGKLFAFDQDRAAEQNILNDERFTFVRSNFRYLYNFMRYHNQVAKVDGILADLGVSSHQFDERERGFSFRFDAPLDMRMNTQGGFSAAEILNTYDEAALANVFYLYGELKMSRKIANTIVKKRKENPFVMISDLMEAVKPFIAKEKEKKMLAQVFQALRIEVNNEMGVLKEMLYSALDVLKPGGRLVIMTYHSLEDRLVKNFLKAGNTEGLIKKDFFGNIESPFSLINNKVIVPTPEEIEFNPRARSAKLRIAEKK